jgi:DNA polymerase-1
LLYHAKYQGIVDWKKEIIKSCKRELYVRTLIGRKRHLIEINADDNMHRSHAERECINFIIQGSAADIAKAAMIKIYKDELLNSFNIKTISQIHDEVVLSCPESKIEEAMQRVKELMEHPFNKELDVPLIAEVGFGDNWSQAK